ncbi:DUF1501 domain-containing protein [Aeoliella sp.]|uniref:DUF1501 domain-containing protein n=1 Tax=Aeoliella sp. TaxID=2795800 RepID=UPI003CCC16C3
MSNSPLSIDGHRLLDRRRFLGDAAGSLSALALSSLLASDGALASGVSRDAPASPTSARSPQSTARAKQVLMIFCSGACSQLDTWDYKPELIAHHDQPLPGDAELVSFQSVAGNLTRSPYTFRPRGECGKWTSDLLPRLGELVDDMCFIHSMTAKSNTHGPGENQMSTGFTLDGFPSIGAWTTYALGSESQDLPAFVAIPDPRGVPQAGPNNWSNGFLPAVFQGTAFSANRPIENIARPETVSRSTDDATRAFVRSLNERHLASFPGDSELAARIASYEMAARLQSSAPEVADLSRESISTLDRYGINDPNTLTAGFGRNCLLARRLLERGVRFVQLFNGAYAMGEGVGNWDGHKQLKSDYDRHGPVLDQPAAALLADLKARGMLEDVLVVWCTEFGRMPVFQKGAQGRDHNPDGFTVWLAGAGVKAPYSYGATDAFGHRAVEKVTTIYDLHATILHLLGLEHTQLTFTHNGSQRRLTDVHGKVLDEILVTG